MSELAITGLGTLIEQRGLRAARPSTNSMASDTAVVATRRRFSRHCVEQFEWLARHEPLELIELVQADLHADPVLLAQAAESMALSQHPLTARVLIALLDHQRPYVRECALLGLAPFLWSSLELRDRVAEVAGADCSQAVREVAKELLAAR